MTPPKLSNVAEPETVLEIDPLVIIDPEASPVLPKTQTLEIKTQEKSVLEKIPRWVKVTIVSFAIFLASAPVGYFVMNSYISKSGSNQLDNLNKNSEPVLVKNQKVQKLGASSIPVQANFQAKSFDIKTDLYKYPESLTKNVQTLNSNNPNDLKELQKLYPGETLRKDIIYLVLKNNPQAYNYVENIANQMGPSATLEDILDHNRIFGNEKVQEFAKAIVELNS